MGSEMTINYAALQRVCTDVNITTPYRPHHGLKLTTISLQSRQALSMQLWKVFSGFINATLHAIYKIGDARSATCHILGIHRLDQCDYFRYDLHRWRSWRCSFHHTLRLQYIPYHTYALFSEILVLVWSTRTCVKQSWGYVRQWGQRTWSVPCIYTT